MNIPALSVILNQAQLKQSASLAVMKLAMDTATANAGGVVNND